jgi:hypothetical protein
MRATNFANDFLPAFSFLYSPLGIINVCLYSPSIKLQKGEHGFGKFGLYSKVLN